MDFMFDWEAEGDRFSFEDSDRFEEDSLCSWISEPESLCNNWRGWRKQNGDRACQPSLSITSQDESQVTSLVELASQAVACHVPFEVVEHFYPPIPEVLQLRIAFWSFPENEEDIRLYSCLANGSADEFQKGDHLFKGKAVKEALQIGFHLSATVVPPAPTLAQNKGSFNVAVVFDRRRITSCNCTCSSTASWCAHVVALCLYRIHQAASVTLRAPVSESLSRLHRDQLQKFAQYLISELPQQILPTAQRLLDELLSSQKTAINSVCGAPDPTAGPSASETTTWCLDEATLHENIHKTLIKFCVPSPIVFSDVNYLSSSAPPAAAEWQSLLRPLRGREPEGMWNLLSIVREMYKRGDNNATFPLLAIVTEEVLACDQILTWWFNTKISASHNTTGGHGSRGGQNSSPSSQHAASSLCDEIVTLWRLAALDPALSAFQRDDLATQLREWHVITVEKARKTRGANVGNPGSVVKKADIESFPGFKPAIEACQLDWTDCELLGVAFQDHRRPYPRFSLTKGGESCKARMGKTSGTSQVSCSLQTADKTVVGPAIRHHPSLRAQEYNKPPEVAMEAAYSSSSEGFCDSDRRDSDRRDSDRRDSVVAPHDSDSDLGDLEAAAARRPMRKREKHRSGERAGEAGPSGLASGSNGAASSNGTRSNGRVPEGQEPARGEGGAQGDTSTPSQGLQAPGQAPGPQGGATEGTDQPSGAQQGAAPPPPPEGNDISGDEYQVYFYDTKMKVNDSPPLENKKKKTDEPNFFAGIRKIENKQEILFARAEALHAHGYTQEACMLAKQLAEEMLANPPDLTVDPGSKVKVSTPNGEVAPPAPPTGKGKKKKGAYQGISSFASTTLAKAAFLCNVLIEVPECHHLAFQVGMFGLEMPRPTAGSKALEVKLAYQESELVTLLKRIPPGTAELNIIRDRAEKLRDGKLRSRGEAYLPLTLASFVFDSLGLPVTPVNGSNSRPPSRSIQTNGRQPGDEKLGFEAAVSALGLKANVSEAEHPLLCEGTRRQRGELAVAMLVHYKDDQTKLSKIMDKLLDKEVHQLYKAPSLSTYLGSASSTNPKHQAAPAPNPHHSASVSTQVEMPPPPQVAPCKTPSSGCESDESFSNRDDPVRSSNSTLIGSTSCSDVTSPMATGDREWTDTQREEETSREQGLEYLNLERKFSDMGVSGGRGARPKTSLLTSKDTDSSAVEEDGEGSADYKAWEAKFRCTNLKIIKKHSVGMASIDSGAPETTSSDNSPTMVRRNWGKHQGPGSDSGSSGKSSDSLGSSSSGDKLALAAAKLRENNESPPAPYEARYAPHLMVYSRSSTPNVKGGRYKGKSRIMPTIPNMPSEASAHFMFELAKTVLTKAGGNSSTSLFTQPATNNNPTGPHRALHLCAFQIGLYALGLHNCVSPNWLSRTYSSHVSWITGQAMEIGSAAINILIDTWEGHLTPQEVASLADRASRGRDPNMVRAAAELALSCLPHAQALNPNEIQRALIQCKEQSREMLERASLAVESAAKGGGVYPEVLFDVAKRWYELYEDALVGTPNAHPGPRAPRPVVTAPPELQEGQIALVQAQVVLETSSPPVMQLMPAQQVAVSVPASLAGGQAVQAVAVQGQIPQAMMVPPSIPYQIPPPNQHHSQMPHHPYIAPYSYVQQVPPNFAHHYSAPHIPLHTHNMHPSYMATYPYNQAQQAFTNMPAQLVTNVNAATLYHANVGHLRPPPPQGVQVYTATGQRGVLVPQAMAPQAQAPQHQAPPQEGAQAPPDQQPHQPQAQAQVAPPPDQHQANSTHLNYLLASYRVGMLAMETLGRRVHDDRPQTKYARNPPYGEDVKWLLSMAIKLGASYLQQFCASAVNAIVSPFVLQDIALESAHYFARSNPTQVSQQLRSPMLNSLVQKCLQMFIQCTHQRLHHIPPSEYDDFVGIVCSARNAFCLTPGGMVHFNELLQSLRRSKSCKKELWRRILNGLHTGNI